MMDFGKGITYLGGWGDKTDTTPPHLGFELRDETVPPICVLNILVCVELICPGKAFITDKLKVIITSASQVGLHS